MHTFCVKSDCIDHSFTLLYSELDGTIVAVRNPLINYK